MAEPSDHSRPCSRCAMLERRVAELEAQLAARDARIAQLETRIAQLERLLDQRTRDGKRQAAPFSKGEPTSNPQKPGRKPGNDYGTQAFRRLPDRDPDEVIDVPLPGACPRCGGRTREEHVARQFQVEIPRQPILRRFDVHIGVCACCGQRVHPRHPLQTSDALGAAAVQIGPDAQALIALLKNKLGLSYGDITTWFHDAFGLELTRGAAAHIVRRTAERVEPVYAVFKSMIPQRKRVYPDETGWKVGGRLHWLWDFVTDLFTVYVIRPSRGVDVLAEVLGMDYAGALTHDGWAPYDRLIEARHQQCLAHLLRRAKEILEQRAGRSARFAAPVRDFILHALDLRDRHRQGTLSDRGFAVARGRLEKRLDRLLAVRPRAKACCTFRNHLRKHRNQLLTFLYEENLEATNWPAEQAIRPAVVNRKVFGGNRTWTGAHALEVLASLFATCRQNAIDALTLLSSLLRAARPSQYATP